jgi:predicted phage terminase large subunit-like protein
LLLRRQARKSLIGFTEYTLAKYRAANHHRIIAEHLERVERGEIDRLMLLTAPRHGKSELASRRFPAFALGRKPDRQFISASAGGEFAADFGREVRNLIGSGEFKALFPDVGLAEDSQAKNKWNTSAGGAYYTVGVDGQVMGRGADIFLIDDPFATMADAQSDTKRNSVWNWYQGSVYNRLQPGGAIVVINHRMHEDDLTGRILAQQAAGGDRFEIVELPAINEDGTALWPEAYPLETLDRIRQNTSPRFWSALYQQNPLPLEGGMFKRRWFEIVGAAPAGAKRVRSWDLAATAQVGSNDPDWTVGLKMSRDQAGLFYIEDVERLRGSAHEVERAIIETAQSDGRQVSVRIPQDPGQAGKGQAEYLIRQLAGFTVTAERETGAKEVRASPFASQCEAGNVKLVKGPWNEAFLTEIENFPMGIHDDHVDAASGAFELLAAVRKPMIIPQAAIDRARGLRW